MDNKLQKIANILKGKPSAPAAGMVGQAVQSIDSRPYQLHVKEALAMGEVPMTPEEFQASQGK